MYKDQLKRSGHCGLQNNYFRCTVKSFTQKRLKKCRRNNKKGANVIREAISVEADHELIFQPCVCYYEFTPQ